ncbi:hypothetical protein HK405_000257 [Cladochytrium tenue]|nr:hypothetical protein HK405_000257 [Cladochytrium tenue]
MLSNVKYKQKGYSKDPSELRADVESTRALLPNPAWPFGIGFITWTIKDAPQMFAEALKLQPPLLWFSFGDASEYIAEARRRIPGVKIFAQVQTVADAKAATVTGVDVVVAQGREAGGHGRSEAAGGGGVISLVPAVADAVAATNTVVLAAGGIADGRGLAAALALGADGAAVGTAFVVARESRMHPVARRRVAAAAALGPAATRRTRVYEALRGLAWPPECDFRVVRNQVTESTEAAAVATVPDGEAEVVRVWGERFRETLAALAGGSVGEVDPEVVQVPAGEGVALVREGVSAEDVLRLMAEDTRERLRVLASLA